MIFKPSFLTDKVYVAKEFLKAYQNLMLRISESSHNLLKNCEEFETFWHFQFCMYVTIDLRRIFLKRWILEEWESSNIKYDEICTKKSDIYPLPNRWRHKLPTPEFYRKDYICEIVEKLIIFCFYRFCQPHERVQVNLPS